MIFFRGRRRRTEAKIGRVEAMSTRWLQCRRAKKGRPNPPTPTPTPTPSNQPMHITCAWSSLKVTRWLWRLGVSFAPSQAHTNCSHIKISLCCLGCLLPGSGGPSGRCCLGVFKMPSVADYKNMHGRVEGDADALFSVYILWVDFYALMPPPPQLCWKKIKKKRN